MKVYMENLGCDSNEADTARLRAFFTKNGYSLTTAKDADIQVLMSCGFNQDKIKENKERLKALRKNKGKLVLGGCLSKIAPELTYMADDSFGPREWDVVDSLFPHEYSVASCSPLFDRNKKRIIRVATGCRGTCSYCAIKKATGAVKSRSLNELKEDVRQGLREGVENFVLVAEDVGAYGQDIGITLLTLVDALTALKGRFTLTLTTIHPEWFLKMPSLIDCFANEKVEKKIYIPNQAATNRLLGLMQRNYTIEDYKNIVKNLRTAVPDILIQTDFIVGFPTETKEDIEAAKVLIDELDFYLLQAFHYTDMQKTVANNLEPKVPEEEGIRRTQELIDYFLQKNQSEVGKRLLVNTNIAISENS